MSDVDPYEAVLHHYGRLEFAYWAEIGLGVNRSLPLTEEFNQRAFTLSEANPEYGNSRVINFRLINSNGNIPELSRLDTSLNTVQYHRDDYIDWTSQRIDWNADDAFIQVYNQIADNVRYRIEHSETPLDLRAQESWTYEDRVAWEREISTIINDEINLVPGLSRYRMDIEGYGDLLSETSPSFLNELSEDIENGTHRITFSCREMSVLEGSLLQRMDEEFLPRRTLDGDQYKVASNYFYVRGAVLFNPNDTTPGGHAFVISSATGNIIESTYDSQWGAISPYKERVNPDMTFEDFVRGAPLEMRDGSVYGGYLDSYALERQTTIESSPAPIVEERNILPQF
ncbi:MAG: hypothetical protein ACK4VI_06090 [Alphaproteobacteria bacterium]